MKPIHTFNITPTLPRKLERLRELAYNLYWAWNLEITALFRRLDRELWEETYHNPVLMLGMIKQERLEEAARDEGFLAHLSRVTRQFDEYIKRKAWYQKEYGEYPEKARIAYFSAEFGLTECIPIYSGGLGVLAGDHVKSASDLGLPFVGVGLLYQEGYFSQYLNADGWQQEEYAQNDFYNMPVELMRHPDGTPIEISVEYPEGLVYARVWRIQVGRVPMYMLDSNVEKNTMQARGITAQLYGGDAEWRVRQEMMMGIGGIRALYAVGVEPLVCHMNEGHSAFLGLERIWHMMQKRGLSYREALEAVKAGTVFTVHTPVPAGIDIFPANIVEKYLGHYAAKFGISMKDFLSLGRENRDNESESFSMAILALRLASKSNGVAKLHGNVSRHMWQSVWPDVPEDEVPIAHVTNGIHYGSWISGDMKSLYDRYLGPRWQQDPDDPEIWQRVKDIPDEELWRTHERRRERLVAFTRRRLHQQLIQRGAGPTEVDYANEVLHPESLTIGFARRFATYKRATLLLRDKERLAKILSDKERPLQLIFAGKAHPKDNAGKELIRKLIHLAREEPFRSSIVFIENYDMNVGRYLTQGVDVWLNTPRRPREASGTSGMKVSANASLNLSILDGWWDEAYNHRVGWAIGKGEEYDDHEYQDEVEANALYHLLEREVVPLFYERGRDGLPHNWIDMMKASLMSICPFFNMHRVVKQYTTEMYHPARERYEHMVQDDMSQVKEFVVWREKLYREWNKIRVERIDDGDVSELTVGDELAVQARVYLGGFGPTDVSVELYYGLMDAWDRIEEAEVIRMRCAGRDAAGYCNFVGQLPCTRSGKHGYALRILPNHPDLSNPFEPRLIKWVGKP